MFRVTTHANFAKLAMACLCAGLICALVRQPGWAQVKGYGQTLGTTQREHEFYNNNIRPGDGGGDPADVPNILGGLLDTLNGPGKVNPTPPGSAVDRALQGFELPTTPAPPTPTPLQKPGS